MPAVRGAAMEASSRVVQKEFQAAPDQMRPAGPRSIDEGHQVDEEGQEGPRQRDAESEAPHGCGQRSRLACIALARYRRVRAAADEAALEEEDTEGEGEQDETQGGGAPLVELGPDDGKEDLRREHAEVTAQHDRIAEVRDAFDEADEEGVGEPGAHQGQGNAAEGLPAAGPEGLRGLLERRAHPFDDSDQDEEGDRREGKGLGEPHPGQAVDPARRRYRKRPLHELVDEARASEDQDETEPDDEGRRDDGEHREHAEYALGLESCPRGHESEGESEPGRGDGREERQGQGVPGDAALPATPQAVEPPDLGGAEATEEGAHGERPPVGLRRAHQDAGDGKEREETDEDGDEDHGAGDEDVAPEVAPGREPCREQEEEGGENHEGAAAHAELAVVEGAEDSLEKRPRPAGEPDRESLGERVEEAGGAQ